MEPTYGNEKLIWKIEDMELLIDTFRKPMTSRVFEEHNKLITGWPSFHPSNADPDGKYKVHEYSVYFELEEAKNAYLHIGCIVSTPRLPDLEIVVNGAFGMYYPYPVPSTDKEIKPCHALHASIYNREDTDIYLPDKLFKVGRNCITFVARDDNPVERVDNEQAVLRLDRMADACGFHYGCLELYERSEGMESYLTDLAPSVIYIQDETDRLLEKCRLRINFIRTEKAQYVGKILLSWEDGVIEIPYSFPAPDFGQISIPFLLPDGKGMVSYEIIGDITGRGAFKRKKKWKVYTTPHAHTDIGYTHRQWEVAERLCRNIDTALDMMNGDHGNYFSYIIDSAWQLEEYLQTRSEGKKKQLVEAIRNGKFGVPLNYVDLLTWLPSLEALIHNGDFAVELLEPYSIIPDRVDIVDVASASASYPAILSGSGVKYLIHADNQDRGPFRFNGGLHRHSPFWWKSPDGSRILTWLARMYCELKKVCGSPVSVTAAQKGLEMWLMDYEREDYAPDAVLLYGQEADNTDLDNRTGAFLELWEKNVVYPQLIPSNGSAFFDYVMKFADSFEEYSGDEGAYWEDGAASSAIETFAVRKADAGIRCAEILDSLAVMHGNDLVFPSDNYKEAWRQVLLYDEHTWGAFLSGHDSESLLQQDQWAVKAHMSHQALQWRDRLLTQAMAKLSLTWNNESREVVVYNPYSFPIQDYVIVEIADGETICSSDGMEVCWEVISRTMTQVVAKICVATLSGFSYCRYRLKQAEANDHVGQYEEEIITGIAVLENTWYKVEIDTQNAGIISLFDKELGKELSGGSTFGQVLYAQGGEGTTLVGNHPELKHAKAEIQPAFSPKMARIKKSRIGSSVIIEGDATLGTMVVVYSMDRMQKSFNMEYSYNKEETQNVEAVYVDLPFAVSDKSHVYSDHQTGWVDWSEDTLPGACKEWLPLQTSILLRDDHCDIQIASPEVFLFTVGSPVEGKWTSDLETRGNHIYSYVLNNYWRTNYKGSQGGHFLFRYSITSASKIPYEKASRYGWVRRQGLIGHRMSFQEFRTEVPPFLSGDSGGTLLSVDSKHIIVSTIRGTKDGSGLLFRLQETGGYSGSTILTIPGKRITSLIKTDMQERQLQSIDITKEGTVEIHLNPWEVSSYRVMLQTTDKS